MNIMINERTKVPTPAPSTRVILIPIVYNTNKIDAERISQNIDGDLVLFLVPLTDTVALTMSIANKRNSPIIGPSTNDVAGVIVTLKSSILSSDENETRTFSAIPILR